MTGIDLHLEVSWCPAKSAGPHGSFFLVGHHHGRDPRLAKLNSDNKAIRIFRFEDGAVWVSIQFSIPYTAKCRKVSKSFQALGS